MNRSPQPREEFENLQLPGLGPDNEALGATSTPDIPEASHAEPLPAAPELTAEEEREFERLDGHAQSNAYAIREQARRRGEQATASVAIIQLNDTKQEAKAPKQKSGGKSGGRPRRYSVPPAEHGSWSNLS